MKKRVLSLLLALAMVMSLFTVSAFADEGDVAMTVTNTNGTALVVGGSTQLSTPAFDWNWNTDFGAAYDKTQKTVTYSWSLGQDGDTYVNVNGANTSTLTVTGKAATSGTGVAITCYMTVTAPKVATGSEGGDGSTSPATLSNDEDESSDSKTVRYVVTTNITVLDGTYALKFAEGKSKQADVKLTPSTNGTLTVATTDVQFVKLKSGDATADTAITDGVKISFKVSGQSVTLDGTAIKPVANKTGKSTIQATCTYGGETYTLDVCDVSVNTLGVSASVTNGTDYSVTAKSLADAVAGNIKTVTGLTTAPTLTSLKLTVPTNSWVKDVYFGSKSSTDKKTPADNKATVEIAAADIASTTKKVILTTTAGTVDSTGIAIAYEAAVGSETYNGTLTLKSDYATTVIDTQNADFTKEWVYLDSVGGSINLLRSYTDGNTTYSSSNVKRVTEVPVDPTSASVNSSGQWKVTYIGYESDSNPVAHLVEVTFNAQNYDIIVSGKDGDTPFKFSDFDTFMDRVDYEQDEYYAVDLEYVQFTKAKETGKWELKDGRSTLSTSGTSSKLTASQLESVTLDVTTAGSYDIPFKVYFNYKNSSSSNWTTNASASYDGIIRVYATAEGDIQYDVSYSEKVTFDASDFLTFYRKATGRSNATLNYVVFNDGQPITGTLYSSPSKTSSSYKVYSSDSFYYAPTGSQDSLDYVTYLAASSPKTEYSVYIPFTAYGSSTSKSGVVEIVVNGGLPFTDIKENHTFYNEIKYVYNKGIMNGETATYFNATKSITRIQLARVLYRMAGSPTTYNRRTIAFTDCKNLSTEAANALKWANAIGVIGGYKDNTFKPDTPVTRQAMVTMIYRYAKYAGYDVIPSSYNNLAGFKDAAKVSTSMKDAMNWAVDSKLLGGNNGNLNPAGNTTRGAAAKILANFHSYYVA